MFSLLNPELTAQVMARTQANYATAQAAVDGFDALTEQDLSELHDLANWYFRARAANRWAVADALRRELIERGVIVSQLTPPLYAAQGLIHSPFVEIARCRLLRLKRKHAKAGSYPHN